MSPLLIFIWIFIAMTAAAFWESYAEGRNAWHKGKLGWKIKLGNSFILTAYHFYLFWIMWPILLTLPFIIYGWNFKLFGVLVSAYFSGLVYQDIMWFIVNPVVNFSELNPKFANYYPWIKLGRFKVPLFYAVELFIAFLSWFFIWR
ncbi:MAG: hypothetical protein Q7J54_07885 [Candidatus Woesearchaeota archaeon]|nr:hypothetical protein [Candidatus Woesearchaeota archaeon]